MLISFYIIFLRIHPSLFYTFRNSNNYLSLCSWQFDPKANIDLVVLPCSKKMNHVVIFKGNRSFFITCSHASCDSLWYSRVLHILTFSSSFMLACTYIIGPKRMVICNLNFIASMTGQNVRLHVLKVHQ